MALGACGSGNPGTKVTTATAADAMGRSGWCGAPDSKQISAAGDAEPTWSQVLRRKPRRQSALRADTEEPGPVPSRPDVGGARKLTRCTAPARNNGSRVEHARSNLISPRGAERGEPRSRTSNEAGSRRPPKTAAVLITRAKEGLTENSSSDVVVVSSPDWDAAADLEDVPGGEILAVVIRAACEADVQRAECKRIGGRQSRALKGRLDSIRGAADALSVRTRARRSTTSVPRRTDEVAPQMQLAKERGAWSLAALAVTRAQILRREHEGPREEVGQDGAGRSRRGLFPGRVRGADTPPPRRDNRRSLPRYRPGSPGLPADIIPWRTTGGDIRYTTVLEQLEVLTKVGEAWQPGDWDKESRLVNPDGKPRSRGSAKEARARLDLSPNDGGQAAGTGMRRLSRSAAVLITKIWDAPSYPQLFSMARGSIGMRGTGIVSRRLRKARNGGTLIELPGPAARANIYADWLREVFGERAVVMILVIRMDLRIAGFDDSVTMDKIVRVVSKCEGVMEMWKTKTEELAEGEGGGEGRCNRAGKEVRGVVNEADVDGEGKEVEKERRGGDRESIEKKGKKFGRRVKVGEVRRVWGQGKGEGNVGDETTKREVEMGGDGEEDGATREDKKGRRGLDPEGKKMWSEGSKAALREILRLVIRKKPKAEETEREAQEDGGTEDGEYMETANDQQMTSRNTLAFKDVKGSL
ncbi:hypothetical protein KM043_014308 [Ampulex compressa]|nr:hypothetical protein KM043_014308 [Ampulex compressa]